MGTHGLKLNSETFCFCICQCFKEYVARSKIGVNAREERATNLA